MALGDPGELGARTEVVAAVDGSMYVASTDGATYQDLDLTGYDGNTENGRCIVLNNAANSVIHNVWFRPGDDDTLSVLNDCRGTVVTHCKNIVEVYALDEKTSHAFLLGASPSVPVVNWTAAQGYAGQFFNCDIEGAPLGPRVSGGIWQFVDCTIRVGAICGVDAYGAKINFIRCNFVTQSQPGGAPYWYLPSGPCPVRVAGLSDVGVVNGSDINTSLYFESCTLNGAAVTKGLDLCRKWVSGEGYDDAGTLPVAVVKTRPITE